TFPATGAEARVGAPLDIRGHAWGGERAVARVDVSLDFGASWIATRLDPPRNKYAPRRWRTAARVQQKGYYEIWARAADEDGLMQPAWTPGWNPKGYLNNMQHRVGVFAV
ncbi:MAG: molybdopterin containing oxidoreductase, partial [Parvularculaceae bacterium]